MGLNLFFVESMFFDVKKSEHIIFNNSERVHFRIFYMPEVLKISHE